MLNAALTAVLLCSLLGHHVAFSSSLQQVELEPVGHDLLHASGVNAQQAQAAWGSSWQLGSEDTVHARQIQATEGRVIVVNDIPGHFEVLAGVLHTLHTLRTQKPTVTYVGAPNTPVSWGLLNWLGETPSAEWEKLPLSWPTVTDGEYIDKLETDTAIWRPLRMIENTLEKQGFKADMVVCVSAELAPQVCKQIVDESNPSLLVLVIHRADSLTGNSKLLALHKKVELFALGSHVARLAASKMSIPVAWVLPICPHQPVRGPCTRLACLHGFTVQGALRKYRNKVTSGFTRNYTQLWERLAALKADGTADQPAVRVTVVGKGTWESLNIPDSIKQDVQFYSRLPYQEFWGRIHRSLALVPSLGHEEYYLSRITSTVIASLITSTPIIAEQRLLDAYQFLKPEHVFLRQAGEDEAAAMYRISGLSEYEVLSKRQALGQLAQTLNQEAISKFKGWLKQATSSSAG